MSSEWSRGLCVVVCTRMQQNYLESLLNKCRSNLLLLKIMLQQSETENNQDSMCLVPQAPMINSRHKYNHQPAAPGSSHLHGISWVRSPHGIHPLLQWRGHPWRTPSNCWNKQGPMTSFYIHLSVKVLCVFLELICKKERSLLFLFLSSQCYLWKMSRTVSSQSINHNDFLV